MEDEYTGEKQSSSNKWKDYDQVINVTLSKEDYNIMRDMIERQKSLNWIGKYIRTIVLVALGGLVTFMTVGEHFKNMFMGGK